MAQKYATDPNDCEDVVQDAVIRLLNHISTLRELDRSRTCKYVALTVRSTFLDHERKKRAAQLFPVEEQLGLTQENIRMIVSRAKEKARRLLLDKSGNGGDAHGR